jgi:hypothetical protein
MADILAGWGVQLLSDKISDVLASAVEEMFHNLSSKTHARLPVISRNRNRTDPKLGIPVSARNTEA